MILIHFYQSFTIGSATDVVYSGYFSTRENTDGNASISILSGVGTGGTVIDTSGNMLILSYFINCDKL